MPSDLEMWALIAEAVRAIGSGRVLFGTDGPQPAPDIVTFAQQEIAAIEALPLSAEDKAAVLGTTAAGLLGLTA